MPFKPNAEIPSPTLVPPYNPKKIIIKAVIKMTYYSQARLLKLSVYHNKTCIYYRL